MGKNLMINKLLGLILINYNSNDDLFRLIELLNSKNDSSSFDILVVDNNSYQKSELISALQNIGNLKLLLNKTNTGFAGGVNTGLQYGLDKYEHFLIMNIDIYFEDRIIDNIINLLPNLDYDLAGCKILNKEGDHCLFTGGYLTKMYISGKHFTDERIINIKKINFITGAFMLVNKRLIEKIGLFDPYYFMYSEDTDYCYRAYINNAKFTMLKSIVVFHEQSKIAKKSFSMSNNEGNVPPYIVYFSLRNRIYINRKYRKGINLFLSFLFLFIYISKFFLFYLLKRRWKKIKYLIWAVKDGICSTTKHEKYVITR